MKVIKAALITFVTVFLIVVTVGTIGLAMGGASVLSALGISSTAAFSTLMASAAALAGYSAIGTLVAGGIGMLTSKGINASAGNYGTKIMTKGAVNPRQIIYGKAKVGGTMTQVHTVGTDNHKLCFFVVVSGHECEDFEKIYLNNDAFTKGSNALQTATVSGETVYYINNSKYINTDNENDFTNGYLARFTWHDGSQTARDGLAAATLGNSVIPTTHKFTNCAYFYFEMIFDSSNLNSIPALSFVIKGKNIYDPRTGAVANSDLQRSNPALILRDYLKDTTYGLRCNDDEINDTTNAGGFAAAANTCDQNVTLADGSSTETRYTANGFTTMGASGEGVLQSLLSSCAGKINYTNGKFNLFVGAAQTPSLTITDDDVLAAPQVNTKPRSGDLFNTVKGIFVDSDNRYEAGETPVHEDSTFLAADTPSGLSSANYKKQLEVQLPWTTSVTMAQRLMKIQLKHQRQTVTTTLTTDTKFLRLQPSDFVYFTNSRLSYSQKLFEVIDVSMKFQEAEGVPVAVCALGLKEIANSVYDFATNEYTTPVSEGSDITTSTSISAPTIGTPTLRRNVSGADTKIDIIAVWTNAGSGDVINGTEVTYKESGESDYILAGIAGRGQTKLAIQNVVAGVTYNIRARHFAQDGVYSDYSAVATIAASVSETISAPSSFSVSSGRTFNIEIKWTNPTNTNLRAVKIYEYSSSGTPSESDVVATLSGEPGKAMTLERGRGHGLTNDQTYYYRLKAVTHAGTESSFTSEASGNFVLIQVPALDVVMGGFFRRNTTNTNAPSDSTFNSDFGRLPLDGDILIVHNNNASAPPYSKAYKYGSANAGGGGGSFTEFTDFISGDLIDAETINADRIRAATITAAKMATGTITAASGIINDLSANVINAGSLKADYIEIDGVTLDTAGSAGSKQLIIKQNGVDTDQLAVAAVETTQLNTNAVTTVKVTSNAITENRFSMDSDEAFTSTSSNWTEMADLWFYNSGEGYYAVSWAGGYIKQSTSGSQADTGFSQQDFKMTFQYGSAEPETTAGNTAYGTTSSGALAIAEIDNLVAKGVGFPRFQLIKGTHFVPSANYVYWRLWGRVDTLSTADRVDIIDPYILSIGLKR